MSRQHYPFLDFIRVIACFLVILLHVAAIQFGSFFPAWGVALFYDSLARMSVPLFFMISGFLLLDANITSLSHFYLKRYSRILIPFLAVCVFYYFTPAYKGYSIGSYILHICTHFVDYHLWYVYALIGLYLALPFFIKIVNGVDGRKLAILYASVWAAAFILAPAINHFCKLIPPPKDIADPTTAFAYVLADLSSSLFANFNFIFFYGYMGYFICAWLLKGYLAHFSKCACYLNLLLAIATTAGLIWATTDRSTTAAMPDQLFFNNLSPFVVIQAIAFFIFCSVFKSETRLIKDLSDKSYWIYLVHILILRLLIAVAPLPQNFANIICIPLYASIVFISAYFVAIPLRNAELWLLKISGLA